MDIMDDIDVRDIVHLMNSVEKSKHMTGEEKRASVLLSLKGMLPPDVFIKYEPLIVVVISLLCKITKQDIKLAVNKTKMCFTNCIS